MTAYATWEQNLLIPMFAHHGEQKISGARVKPRKCANWSILRRSGADAVEKSSGCAAHIEAWSATDGAELFQAGLDCLMKHKVQ